MALYTTLVPLTRPGIIYHTPPNSITKRLCSVPAVARPDFPHRPMAVGVRRAQVVLASPLTGVLCALVQSLMIQWLQSSVRRPSAVKSDPLLSPRPPRQTRRDLLRTLDIHFPGNLRRAVQRSERVVERASVRVSSVGSWNSARARDANHGMAAGPLLASESLTDGIAPSNTWFDARASQLHVRAHSLTPARGGPRRQPAECSACPRDRSSLAHTSGYVLSRSICPCFDAHFHGPSRVLSLSLRQAAPPVPPSTT